MVWLPDASTPTYPHHLKITCMLPDETDMSEECPTIRWNGITYWIYSYSNNSIAMAIVARDESDEIITRIIEKNGARYLNNASVDYDAETITLTGQSQDTITFPWTELTDLLFL